MNILCIATDFTKTPGARYVDESDWSGEQFRESLLAPRLRAAITDGVQLVLDLDGTAGYGTSFLEEAFGGLIRQDGLALSDIERTLRIRSTEEPYLEEDIWQYLRSAAR